MLAISIVWGVKVAYNGLQLKEVGDFEALNCLIALNLMKSTKLHLTAELPIYCRCCCGCSSFRRFCVLLFM